jgi:hypothetical protein
VHLHLLPCENSTTPSVPVCQPLERISAVLDANYLSLIVSTQVEGAPNPKYNLLSLKSALSTKQVLPFVVYETTIYPNLLTSWTKTVFTELQLQPPISSIDRLPRLVSGSDREFVKIDFQLTGVFIRETRSQRTVFDFIGLIAAFASAIYGFAHKFMWRYNKYRFYKKYPMWDKFPDNFMEGSTNASVIDRPPHPPSSVTRNDTTFTEVLLVDRL